MREPLRQAIHALRNAEDWIRQQCYAPQCAFGRLDLGGINAASAECNHPPTRCALIWEPDDPVDELRATRDCDPPGQDVSPGEQIEETGLESCNLTDNGDHGTRASQDG